MKTGNKVAIITALVLIELTSIPVFIPIPEFHVGGGSKTVRDDSDKGTQSVLG